MAKKYNLFAKHRHIHKKIGFGAVMLVIIVLALLTAVSNQKQIEHKEICDAIEEGITKEYRFGDYSYRIGIVDVETPGRIEFKVNGRTVILNKGEQTEIFELQLRAITIYWQEASGKKDTVKFCIKA